MPRIKTFFLTLLALLCLAGSVACAEESALLPKYGPEPKSAAQKAADAAFIAKIDDRFQGDRQKAAREVSSRGWQLLREGHGPEAMRRFNQAWLIDPADGNALWGMAAVQADLGNFDSSLQLFAEAEAFVGDDITFQADHARAIAIAGASRSNSALLDEAFNRFARIHRQAPEHMLNLQNWAITLFYVGDYAAAWEKVKLAEATPRAAEIDADFLQALESKMARP